jgi:hypothetical protein
MPDTMQLPGGRLWNRKTEGVPGWSSADAQFDILEGKGYVVLVAFEHEGDTSEFWRRRFTTVKEAMKYAEQM